MPNSVIVSYPFDPTGILASNRILDEQHAVTENNFRDFYFIVPKFGPFFSKNISVVHSYQGVSRTLVENVDYYCALMFIGATRSTTKPIYGAITLNNLNTSGIISISYNTLGAEWVVDDQFVIEQIAEKAYNPRTVSWEHIVDLPSVFPPIPHAWDLVDLVGQTEIVGELANIEAAILTNATNQWNTHTTLFNNPHNVTKVQLGLGNVGNWTIATNQEMALETSNDSLVTPKNLGVKIKNYYTKEEIDLLIENFKEKDVTSRAKLFFLAQH